jgi:3-hydroxybutyrate dehydrogenase
MTTLTGKTALVTGSTSGIGLGIAQALAEAGANIVLNGFGDIDTALTLIRSHGVQAWHHPADLSDPAQIDALCAFAAHETGGVDILVNNAGIQHVAPIEAFPPAQWDKVLAINLSAVFHTSRLLLPLMRQQCNEQALPGCRQRIGGHCGRWPDHCRGGLRPVWHSRSADCSAARQWRA